MARIAPSRRIPPHQLNALEARMQAYYAAVPDYPAFHAASEHPLELGQVLAELRKRRANASPLAIFEFGAGRSGSQPGCGSSWHQRLRALPSPSPARM